MLPSLFFFTFFIINACLLKFAFSSHRLVSRVFIFITENLVRKLNFMVVLATPIIIPLFLEAFNNDFFTSEFYYQQIHHSQTNEAIRNNIPLKLPSTKEPEKT